MAKAAYCDKCGANVYVSADGSCPNGHGPESLSNHYETDEQPKTAPEPVVSPPVTPPPTVPTAPTVPTVPTSPAATAYAQADPISGAPKKKSKAGLIIGIVLAILLLCGVGGTLATCAVFNAAEDMESDLSEALEEAASEIEAEIESELDEAPFSEDEEPIGEPDGIGLETEAMINYFYPGFTLVDYAETDTVDGATGYHVLAQSTDAPDFYITFFADRVPGATGTDPITQFTDDRAGVMWDHPQTTDHGLGALAGPNPLVPDEMRLEIMSSFGEAHFDMNVSEFALNSNVKITLRGISDDDLDAWYDDFTTFESVWESNLTEGTWEETSFTRQ